jgi:16S rRNA (cytosine1402-N4)-methyltransferase
MLAAHPELETLVGIDRDKSALEIASNHLIRQATREEHPRLHFLHGNFCEMAALCRSVSVQQVDGILLDLGVSSMQLDRAERGFSFGGSARARIEATQGGNAFAPWDAPLDMRMDQHAPESLTARHIVNTWSESELFRIFREYGEEPRARQIARRIVEARKRAPIETTGQLATLVLEAKGVRRRIQFRDRKPREDTAAFSTRENSDSDERPSLPVMEQVGVWYRGRQRHQGGGGVLHPATLTFQALRIAVNDELESLRAGLRACLELLRPGGRLVVISFHRLEDRIVKWAFREKVEQRSPSDALEWTASPWSRPRVAVTEQEKRHDDSDDDLVDDFGEQTKALTHFLEALNKPPTGESDAQTSIRAPAGSWRLVTKKPIVPTMEEIRQNPRCRSAKLRVIERESDEV